MILLPNGGIYKNQEDQKMKKIIAVFLAVMMLVSLSACGIINKDAGSSEVTTSNEQQNTSKPDDTAPTSEVVITDDAETVAKSMGVDLTEMYPDAFAVDGQVLASRFNLSFLIKDKIGKDEIISDFKTLSSYLKGISADGKLYQETSFDAEWDEEIVTEGDRVIGEMFCVKLGDFGWSINAAYSDDPGCQYIADGVYYPYYHLVVERIDL